MTTTPARTRSTAPSLDIVIPADRSDLSTWTPQQVDTVLAEIHVRVNAKRVEVSREYRYLDEAKKNLDPTYRWYRAADADMYTRSAAKHQAKIDALHAEIVEISKEAIPFNDEYKSRPWTRAWIVTSSEGHVHNTMDCSTCNKVYRKQDGTYSEPTEFGWLPQVSGLDEAEIVDLAGEAACTVCYPSAPVASLSQPNLLDTAERLALKAAKSAEKDAKTAERIAKGVTPDGTPLVVEWQYESTRDRRVFLDANTYRVEREPYIATCSKVMKTERAAELFVVETLAAVAKGRGVNYNYAGREVADQVLAALAWKRNTTPEAVEASLAAKVEKKRKGMY